MSDPGSAVVSPGEAQAALESSQASSVSSPVRLAVWRRIVQFGMVAVLGQWSFYGIFRCPFLVPYVSCENCPVITCHGRIFSMFWGFWLLLPVSVILFGRAFCGWACAGGLVNQLAGMLAPVKLRARNLAARLAPWGKIVGLAVALHAWFILLQPRGNVPIRTGEFFKSVALTFEHSGTLWIVRTLIVLGFLALGLIVANAWCRFACPTGGILDLIGRRVGLFQFRKTSRCNDCNLCMKVCEMGTRPGEANCTNCGDCLDACRAGAIRFGRRRGGE